MAKSALFEISSFPKLEKAWTHLRNNSSPRSRLSYGIDLQSINDFNRNPVGNCRVLSNEIRVKNFSFSPLIAHLIPKKDGRDRVICVPCVRDRVVQRSLNDYLAVNDKCGLKNGVSFGFIPNRSVELAAKTAINIRASSRWAYKTDISKFFDSISREKLALAITKTVRDRSLHKLLISACACEIEEPRKTRRERIKAAGIHVGRGVRQGMPLSPFFANLILKRFDKAIESAGIKMIRYADDLICFANDEPECQEIHAVVRAALEKEELQVPDPGPQSKTQIYNPEEPAEFLGVSLRPENGSYILEVGSDQTAKIRQRLLDLGDLTELLANQVTLSGFFKRLDGAICGYEGAYEYCSNFSHLQSMLSGARIAAVTRLFEQGLGIDITSLSEEKKAFLGIL